MFSYERDPVDLCLGTYGDDPVALCLGSHRGYDAQHAEHTDEGILIEHHHHHLLFLY